MSEYIFKSPSQCGSIPLLIFILSLCSYRSYQCSFRGHPGWIHRHTWPSGDSETTPVCSGTQTEGHSCGCWFHTRQYLNEVKGKMPLNLLHMKKSENLKNKQTNKKNRTRVSTADLYSCCCPWVHSRSHSWLLSGSGRIPPCWCNALHHDSCLLRSNIHLYLSKDKK